MVIFVNAFLGFIACFFLSLVVFLILNRFRLSEQMSDCFGAAGGMVTTGLVSWILWDRPEGMDGTAWQGQLLGVLIASLVLVITYALMKRQDARIARP
jgi:Na+/proline symporter